MGAGEVRRKDAPKRCIFFILFLEKDLTSHALRGNI
nr:MAG TPA: hypothetical protein [Caudoviricetes sp.]